MATFKKYKKKGETFYMFKTYLGTDPATGKRIDTSRRGFKTLKEAKTALRQLQVDFKVDGWHEKNKIITFDDLFTQWLDSYKLTVRPATVSNRKYYYKHLFQDKIGHLRLESITPAYLQKLFDSLAKDYSRLSVYVSVLHMPLEYAYRLDLIPNDPFTKIVVPKGRPSSHAKEINYYSKDELKYFLECAKQLPDERIYLYFRILAYTGLRRSEGLALTWKDIDFEQNTITVNKTVIYDKETKQAYIQKPKTKTSLRTLSVDQTTMNDLAKWHATQQRKIFRLETRPNGDFLFVNRKNQLFTPSGANRWLELIYKKYPQKKISVHGFRHTHASLLFESGASLKEVQQRLGHSTSKFTLDVYTHVMKSRSSQTGQNFADYMQK